MTTNTWPLPWRIAAALARELDWARWAYGETARCDCWTNSRNVHDDGCSQSGKPFVRSVVPVPDPSDAEAYRADCARRGVEPGPMPALSFDNPTGYGWKVEERHVKGGNPGVRVCMSWCGRSLCTWMPDDLRFNDEHCHRVHAVVFIGWATAAARAMGATP